MKSKSKGNRCSALEKLNWDSDPSWSRKVPMLLGIFYDSI